MAEILKPEDYIEPKCLLCEDPYGAAPKVKSVPQQRIIEKMNDYMSRRDYVGAERHLLYWLEEAKLGGDERGELMLRNELVGHYRKTSEKEKAFLSAARALELLEKLDFSRTVSGGTTFVNVATAYNAFGENEKAALLFEKAEAAYEGTPGTDPALLGGLYNNMALTLVALRRFSEARTYYDKALLTMETVPGGELEQAITYLNIADAIEAEKGAEAGEKEIFALLDKAAALLDDTAAPRDGYYAFVCEKCAPSFSYYGYFSVAGDLEKRAREIYERH